MPQQFIGFIGAVDAVLVGLLILLSLGIMAQVILKQHRERKRVFGLAALLDTLRTLALRGPDTIENTYPRLILKTDFRQFFELTQNIETALPHELEQRVKECLSFAKISQIEKTAKRSWRKWRRIEALLLLGYINAPTAVPILQASIGSKDEDIAYFSMIALGKIHTVESARVLLDFLTRRIFSGHKIVSLLEKFPSLIVDEVFAILDHYDPFVRFWALKLLMKFKPAVLLEKIIPLTSDPSADVRAASCEYLGEAGLLQPLRALSGCLEDEVWFVRMHAVRALYKIQGVHCLAEVIGLINDKAWLVQESVKQIMVNDIEASLSHITACLCSGNQQSQRVCIGALVDSGYIKTLLSNLLSSEGQRKEKSIALLTLLINSNIHFGLKKTLDTFGENDHKKILEAVYIINKDLAGQIAQY